MTKFAEVTRDAWSAVASSLDSRNMAWAVGVVTPPLMLYLDPVVFREGSMGLEQAILGQFRTASYLGIAMAVTALTVVLTTDRAKAKAFLSGLMGLAAVLGALLGMVMLPFSLLGILFFGLGLLGLSPFLCAAVYARWSWRTLRQSTSPHRQAQALAGALGLAAVCVTTQLTVSHVLKTSMEDILSGSESRATAATERLVRWRAVVDMDQFMTAWRLHRGEEAGARLARSYHIVTGEDLEERAMRAAD